MIIKIVAIKVMVNDHHNDHKPHHTSQHITTATVHPKMYGCTTTAQPYSQTSHSNALYSSQPQPNITRHSTSTLQTSQPYNHITHSKLHYISQPYNQKSYFTITPLHLNHTTHHNRITHSTIHQNYIPQLHTTK